MKVSKSVFGKMPDGKVVYLYTLHNTNGVEVGIINYGAIITSIHTPDRNGNFDNIVCGFSKLEHYLSEEYLAGYPYFGCICGRIANRINKGKFILEDKEYQLAVNNGSNHLHGGSEGFDRRYWQGQAMVEEEKVGVLFSYFSPDGEENYPGNLNVSCLYSLNNANELMIDYFAHTDQETIINLTNHTYFNLTGGKEKILDHGLSIASNCITESIDLIPTGRIIPITDTIYDFMEFKRVGKDIGELEHGYDLNYVLDNDEEDLVYAACLRECHTRRQVEVFTTQPGIQLYTGYWIPELEIEGKKCFGSYSGIALETQHYPDAINHPHFPQVILEPGEKYQQSTVYRFGLID
jgi:aldose 1-epimerase